MTGNRTDTDLFGSADEIDPYLTFRAAVTLAQLTNWLVQPSALVLDLSHPLPGPPMDARDTRISEVVASAGHRSLVVVRSSAEIELGPYKHPVVVGDPRSLDWVRTESVNLVIAEGGALSDCLAAEDTLADVARILRPGGRLLASAVSLTSGLSQLAEQHRWLELADAPAADVMLLPDPGNEGSYLRCFGPEELRELVSGARLDVDWIRSCTVLPASAVRQTLATNAVALGDLVANELSLEGVHEGESHGSQLTVSARKPL